jgi:hypothetical protein
MDYIVVPQAEAEIVRVALGMLLAQFLEEDYPMPGGSLYAWDPLLSEGGTQAAFGPFVSEGVMAGFGEWALGKSIEMSVGTITMPSTAQELTASWFPPPPEDV